MRALPPIYFNETEFELCLKHSYKYTVLQSLAFCQSPPNFSLAALLDCI